MNVYRLPYVEYHIFSFAYICIALESLALIEKALSILKYREKVFKFVYLYKLITKFKQYPCYTKENNFVRAAEVENVV